MKPANPALADPSADLLLEVSADQVVDVHRIQRRRDDGDVRCQPRTLAGYLQKVLLGPRRAVRLRTGSLSPRPGVDCGSLRFLPPIPRLIFTSSATSARATWAGSSLLFTTFNELPPAQSCKMLPLSRISVPRTEVLARALARARSRRPLRCDVRAALRRSLRLIRGTSAPQACMPTPTP